MKNGSKIELDKVYLEDCMKAVKHIPDKAFDIIITDPPYMLKKVQSGKGSLYSFKSHLKEIDEKFGSNFNPTDFLDAWLKKSKNGALCWCNRHQLPIYMNYACKHKYKWELIIWCKTNTLPQGGTHLKSDIEFCLRLYKPKFYFNNNLTDKEYSRWFLAGTNNRLGHPCVKPLEEIERHVKLFTKEGDVICDPFAGSGTTCVAAKKLGRHYVGFEKIESYYDIAVDRIERQAAGQTTIFDSMVSQRMDEIDEMDTMDVAHG